MTPRNLVHIALARRDRAMLTSPDGKNIQVALDAVVTLVNEVEASTQKHTEIRCSAASRDELAALRADREALRVALGEMLPIVEQAARRQHGVPAWQRDEPDDCTRELCGRVKAWRALVSAGTAPSSAASPTTTLPAPPREEA